MLEPKKLFKARRVAVIAIVMVVLSALFGVARVSPASATSARGAAPAQAPGDDEGDAGTETEEPAEGESETPPAEPSDEATPGDTTSDEATPDDDTTSDEAEPDTSAPDDSTSSKVAARSKFKVKSGITLNSPLGGYKTKYAILRKIHHAIMHAPRGSHMWIMSWNLRWQNSVDQLLRAQRRGVIIRVLMDSSNSSRTVPNPPWRRLARGFRNYNKKVPRSRRSYLKECSGACRASRGGQAHSKYFLFEQSGRSDWVVMQGSSNLTLASAINQWNDLYTHAEKIDLYRFFVHRFKESWRDRSPRTQWMRYEHPKFRIYMSPRGTGFRSSDRSDPLLRTLRATRCKGTTGGAGNRHHRTVIRVAPDVLRGVSGTSWGWKVAYRLRKLWNAGCDVKVGYTVMGKAIYRLLKRKANRGPVPMRHLVQDFNGDKEFDRYFHMKVWAINGVIGNDTSAYWVQNGSSNISPMSGRSDENIGIYRPASIVKRYQKHIEYWFNNPPRSARVVPSRIRGVVDPYRNVDLD